MGKKEETVGGGVVGICVGIDADEDKFGMDLLREGLSLWNENCVGKGKTDWN